MSTELATQESPRATGWVADDSTFGARLALIRQKLGWGNVKEAAIACGLPPESWRTWERDNVEPRRLVTVAKRIATRTGCSYSWLVLGPDRTGEEPRPPKRGRDPLKPRILSRGSTDRAPRDGRPADFTRSVRQTRPVSHQRQRSAGPIGV